MGKSKNTMTALGREIDRLQKKAGLDDTALAAKLGISQITLQRWKHGRVETIRLAFMEKIERICGGKMNQKVLKGLS